MRTDHGFDVNQPGSQISLVVQRHQSLEREAAELDPYRTFGFVIAGRLFYARLLPPEVVSSQEIVCPFAKTTLDDPLLSLRLGATGELIHVLTLMKVSGLYCLKCRSDSLGFII